MTAARKRLAPGLACFLAGCSEAGYKYTSEFYGSLVPFQAVGLSLRDLKPAFMCA